MNENDKFKEALRCRNSDDISRAKELLLELVNSQNASVSVFAILGEMHWDSGELQKASDMFRRGMSKSPTSEAISLGLFHCLWESNKRDEAMKEVKRFVTLTGSTIYDEIIREINSDEGNV